MKFLNKLLRGEGPLMSAGYWLICLHVQAPLAVFCVTGCFGQGWGLTCAVAHGSVVSKAVSRCPAVFLSGHFGLMVDLSGEACGMHAAVSTHFGVLVAVQCAPCK